MFSFHFTLNICLNTSGAAVLCIAWFIREFRVFQHHTFLTRQTLSEMINLLYTFQFMQKWKEKMWLSIYLDDYRPLARASDWLL